MKSPLRSPRMTTSPRRIRVIQRADVLDPLCKPLLLLGRRGGKHLAPRFFCKAGGSCVAHPHLYGTQTLLPQGIPVPVDALA